MFTDVVWPETKQIMIIDSIFRNFYIPPVIFAVKVHDDGSETKTCIDGKQRLTSIHRYEKASFMSFTGTNVGVQKVYGWNCKCLRLCFLLMLKCRS